MITFKGDTPDRTHQVGFWGCCLIGAIGLSLSDKSMIFGSGKSWNVGLNREKVFYPLRKFFTPLLGTWCYKSYFQILQFFWFSWGQKGGKKLFAGVKNFSISKYAIQVLPEWKIKFISQKLIEGQKFEKGSFSAIWWNCMHLHAKCIQMHAIPPNC